MELPSGQINFIPESEIQIKETEAIDNSNLLAVLFRILLLVIIITGTGLGTYFAISRATLAQRLEQVRNQNLLLSTTLQMANWQDLGNVSEPKVELPVKTTSGFKKILFLLDSGAVVSSLPREMADEMGQNLAFLKRTTFLGFGNNTSFAYHSSMDLKMGDTDVSLPVVFTESASTQPLLGRKGFFDNYSITFNHILHSVEIRQ